MIRASAKTVTAFLLPIACLLPLQTLAAVSITSYLSAQEPVFTTSKSTSLSEEQKSEEYRIGVMVKALSAAITSPAEPESLEIITRYGTDSRYYVMIRGWLVQELSGVQSQLDANRNDKAKEQLIERVALLSKAIRRIDLE
ncbi:hypothetical protein [uncultured Shewanella sp.]|uniref:hypothetical protein n=1 Tax=Shewanella atlantica TaxID=271099 RepID=UPI0026047075|nr:hypothetical protein [uncultured Shewanella sp.]